jgi:hypothetical protein
MQTPNDDLRISQDLDEGFAAVALLRGTTKSGLVSEYSAEHIRAEQERDGTRFGADLKEIQSHRKSQLKTTTAPITLVTGRPALPPVAESLSD